MRRRLVTVRLPGARMAPTSRISAWRQVRWRKSGAKAKMIAAKRADRYGMAVALGGDISHQTASLASPPYDPASPARNGQSRAKNMDGLDPEHQFPDFAIDHVIAIYDQAHSQHPSS